MENKHLFSNLDLKKLLVPLVVEQLLNSMMGIVDTLMVSNVSEEAVSAVSLVDSVNILIIQLFTALATGGVIVCSHYIGSGKSSKAKEAARQLVFVVTFISVVLTALMIIFNGPLLRAVFGDVTEGVMRGCKTYFYFTAVSFPFIALYDAGASIFRAQEDTKTPMKISILSNFINVGGNAVLIFVFDLGIMGAAAATLASRVFCGVVIMWKLRNEEYKLCIRDYFSIRPDFSEIKRILFIGIPAGVENCMFQFGKLAIQSTVSTMGTAAIAAQALTNILENLNGIGGIGIGIGLMTIVGECLGAGRKDEAIYYIKKLTVWAEMVIIASCALVFVITKPLIALSSYEGETASMVWEMIIAISIVKPIVWVFSFIPGYGLRAAGDVKFSMIVSCLTMWLCRVSLCIFLATKCGMGPMAVWIGMFADWTIRGVIFLWRFKSEKWLKYKIIE